MNTGSVHHDPRSIITPDVFDISEELLGTPLASPSRRLMAWPIDLAVIGLVTLVTSSFGMILGFVAAAFFIRAGFKRTKVKNSVFGRAMRFSVGCLGVFIGLFTAAIWGVFGANIGFDGDDDDSDAPSSVPAVISNVAGSPVVGQILGVVATAALESAMIRAEDLEGAEEEVVDFIGAAEELGVEREEILTLVLAAVPDDASWADQAEARFTELVIGDVDSTERERAATLQEEVAAYSPEEAARAYAALLDSDADDAEEQARLTALADRLTTEVAADTLRELQQRIAGLEDDQEAQARQLQATQQQLAAETEAGVFASVLGFVDELGFGFGWAALYLTIFLSWWNGQTVGKRMMGLRVVRLDGEPITWWVAFERSGGYAAGFATGLLGFAQVFWDANRQGIHDRIVGTVVVVDGAEKVQDWESAL